MIKLPRSPSMMKRLLAIAIEAAGEVRLEAGISEPHLG